MNMSEYEKPWVFEKVWGIVSLHCIMYPLPAVSIPGGCIMCSHLWWQGCLFVNPAVPALAHTATVSLTVTEVVFSYELPFIHNRRLSVSHLLEMLHLVCRNRSTWFTVVWYCWCWPLYWQNFLNLGVSVVVTFFCCCLGKWLPRQWPTLTQTWCQ